MRLTSDYCIVFESNPPFWCQLRACVVVGADAALRPTAAYVATPLVPSQYASLCDPVGSDPSDPYPQHSADKILLVFTFVICAREPWAIMLRLPLPGYAHRSSLLFSSPLGVSFSRRRSHSIRGILIDFLPDPITDEMSIVKGTVSRQCLSHDLCSYEHLSRAGIKEFHSISATIDVYLSGLRLRNHIEHFYLMSLSSGFLFFLFIVLILLNF